MIFNHVKGKRSSFAIRRCCVHRYAFNNRVFGWRWTSKKKMVLMTRPWINYGLEVISEIMAVVRVYKPFSIEIETDDWSFKGVNIFLFVGLFILILTSSSCPSKGYLL